MASLAVIRGSGTSTDSTETYNLYSVGFRDSKKNLVRRKVVAASIEEAVAKARRAWGPEIAKLTDVSDAEETIII